MYSLEEIKELMELLDSTSLQELEIEHDGSRISLRKPKPAEPTHVISAPTHTYAQPMPQHHTPVQSQESTATPAGEAQPSEESGLHKIVSPMVGTFYSSPSPESGPYVQAGDQVTEKSIVCIVEAMKLMNEIEAEVKGTIVEILADNGELVEFGQPLFLVKPE